MTLFPSPRARRRAPSLLLVLLALCGLLGLTGCTPTWLVLKESGPPSALRGAPSVSVSFDYSTLVVNGMGRAKTETEWVEAKAAEDPSYPATWEALKGKWEEGFMDGFAAGSPVPVTRTVAGGEPPADAVSLVVMMNQLQIGKYVPFNTTLTTVQATYAWSRGDKLVDEIRTISYIAPTLLTPSVAPQLASIGHDVGRSNGKFARHKLR
jgi:hypothetical protein